MIYPSNFEEKIGFNQIRNSIKDECLCVLGKQMADNIRFLNKAEKINKLLSQSHEMQQILLNGESFPQQDYYDIRPYLEIIKTPGRYIEADQYLETKLVLETIEGIIHFIQNRDLNLPDIPSLKSLTQNIHIEHAIIQKINLAIDDKGNVKDTASGLLKEIRNNISTKRQQTERRIVAIMKKAIADGLVSPDAQLTIRNSRSVIPIPAGNKRSIKGYVHDESATGQTAYIEPAEIFELNNEISDLIFQEKREIVKILTETADFIRPYNEDIHRAIHFLGIIDFIRAKAKYAISIKANLPSLSYDKTLTLKNAHHPLLYKAHQQQNKSIIPLNIHLDKQQRIVLISGPNAGGKSVCLKTVGLLQYMLQCGLLIPTEESSTLPIFDNLFIDIGDEQSIENDLSTYSSHLYNMNRLLSIANKDTLILIDEFGTGTEPQLGGAIAESILKELNDKKAFGVINTHFSNLKNMAEKTEGIQNAAMLFDTKNMKPLYILEIGKPGSSYAFEIASNIGLPKQIIEYARKKAGTTHYNYDKQLQELEFEALQLHKKSESINQKEQFLDNLIQQYEKLKLGNTELNEQIRQKEAEILNTAKKEAARIIENANSKIENTIRQIKEQQADKEKTIILRQELLTEKKTIENEIKQSSVAKKPKEIDQTPLKEGDYVRMHGNNVTGKIIKLKKNTAQVEFGSFMSTMNTDKLEKISKAEHKKTKQQKQSNIITNITEKQANFTSRLDIRGKRAEEVYEILQKFIDEASLLDIKELQILHGKGDGILRQVVRQYLNMMTEVARFHDEHIDFGGSGITIVHLK